MRQWPNIPDRFMILLNRCLLKSNLFKIKIYWMKTDTKHILSANVWKAMPKLRGKDWLRTQMLRADWSRSKWIINFPTGVEAGQRLRNEEKYLTVDVTSFLLLWSTLSQNPGRRITNPVGLVFIEILNSFQFHLN